MSYTVAECEEVLANLREAKVKLSRQTMAHSSVNSVEITRIESDRINKDISYWQTQLNIAKRIAGDLSGSKATWVG